MLEKLARILNQMDAHRLLDLATRTGDFAGVLAQNLRSYDELIGIDINPKPLVTAREKFASLKNVAFEERDVYATGFPDQSFDLVAISNSIHHFSDRAALFAEIRRLLTPDGLLIVNELTTDGQTGAPATHAMLHAFDIAVDTLRGVYHGDTLRTDEVDALLAAEGFVTEQAFMDQDDDPARVPALEKRLANMHLKLEPLTDTPQYPQLVQQMDAVRQHHQDHGVAPAWQYILFARQR